MTLVYESRLINVCNKRDVVYIILQSLLSRGYSAVGMSWHVPAGGQREGSATRECGKACKTSFLPLEKRNRFLYQNVHVKISVGSVSSYSRVFHEVTLIFTVCCVLQRWFVSVVSQRISSNVEVSV